MTGWVTKPLADLAQSIDYGVTASASDQPVGPKFLRITDIQNGRVDWAKVPWCACDPRSRSEAQLRPGDIVFARTGATTGKTFLIKDCPADVVFASYLIRVRVRDGIEPRFVSHFFRTPSYWAQISTVARGVAQPGVNATTLRKLQIPVPSAREQLRIADTLDSADALRANRLQTITKLDELGQSVFLDMFGPSASGKGWPLIELNQLLSIPLRNGLSPSKSGKVIGKVLTLSAITGDRFDASAIKTSTFNAPPPSDQIVDEADFLICRGNGNRGLVGKGQFPTHTMPDVLFPDTVIAARISLDRMDRAYFQHVWNTRAVRNQIESMARTTNGTFKVNQTMLEGILLSAPPVALQRDFAQRSEQIARLRTTCVASLAELDALFASLQQRAFNGEL